MYLQLMKKNEHNMTSLQNISSATNPVAKIQNESISLKPGCKPIAKHFDNEGKFSTPLLCKNAKVKIAGRNFNPIWGLFNGAIGTINAIVFSKNNNPNKGHHPDFVVVNFPQYKGPYWDKNNPTVS